VWQKVTSYQQNLEGLSRENDELKRRINEYESKIALLSQEIERINIKLRAKEEETISVGNNYRNLTAEHENLKRHLKEYESSVANKFEVEVIRKYSQY